jgi:hypothetical protein
METELAALPRTPLARRPRPEHEDTPTIPAGQVPDPADTRPVIVIHGRGYSRAQVFAAIQAHERARPLCQQTLADAWPDVLGAMESGASVAAERKKADDTEGGSCD